MISSFAARATVRRPCGGTSGSPAVQRSEHRVDREPARHLTGRVPAHAVGKHEDRAAVPRVVGRGRHERSGAVFVVVASRTRLAHETERELRERPRRANRPVALVGSSGLVAGLRSSQLLSRPVRCAGEPRPSARSAQEGARRRSSRRSASARRHRSCCSRRASCGSGCGIVALTSLTRELEVHSGDLLHRRRILVVARCGIDALATRTAHRRRSLNERPEPAAHSTTRLVRGETHNVIPRLFLYRSTGAIGVRCTHGIRRPLRRRHDDAGARRRRVRAGGPAHDLLRSQRRRRTRVGVRAAGRVVPHQPDRRDPPRRRSARSRGSRPDAVLRRCRMLARRLEVPCSRRWTTTRSTRSPRRSGTSAPSDRNFYDRYYFNLHGSTDELFMVIGMGQYPNLATQDAFACVCSNGKQRVLRASKELGDRMDTTVGPFRVEVIEPLQPRARHRRADRAPARVRPHLDRRDPGVRGAAALRALARPRDVRQSPLRADRLLGGNARGRGRDRSRSRPTAGRERATARGASDPSARPSPPASAARRRRWPACGTTRRCSSTTTRCSTSCRRSRPGTARSRRRCASGTIPRAATSGSAGPSSSTRSSPAPA